MSNKALNMESRIQAPPSKWNQLFLLVTQNYEAELKKTLGYHRIVIQPLWIITEEEIVKQSSGAPETDLIIF